MSGNLNDGLLDRYGQLFKDMYKYYADKAQEVHDNVVDQQKFYEYLGEQLGQHFGESQKTSVPGGKILDQDGDMPRGAREALGALGKTIDDFNRRQAEDGNNAQYKDFQDLGAAVGQAATTHPRIYSLNQSQKNLHGSGDDFPSNNTLESRAQGRRAFGNCWGDVTETMPSSSPFTPYDWKNVASGLRKSLTKDPFGTNGGRYGPDRKILL